MGATMKHGEGTRLFALSLYRQGLDTPAISKKLKVNQNLLRTWKRRYLENGEEEKTAVAESVATLQNEEVLQEVVSSEAKEAVAPVAKRSYKAFELEAIFYATSLTACYGFVTALPGVVGYSIAIVYALFCVNSLQMAKNADIPQTAERGKNRVWALEFVAGFAHYFTVNRALWSNLDALPFEVKYVPKGGMWVLNNGVAENGIWQGGEIIFALAVIMAGLLSFAAIEAISTRLQLTKETSFTAPQGA